VHIVPPKRPWQIPVASDSLIAGALAKGRKAVLDSCPARRDGLPDAEVVARHERLRAAVTALAVEEPRVLEQLESLEAQPPDAASTQWQTPLMLIDADEDPDVIELALDVWDALGPNSYGLEFRLRRRTWRGFQEGRSWLQAGTLGTLALAVISIEQASDGSGWWVAWAAAAAAWPLLVWRAFRRSYRRREAIARKELPYF
jgi:hypothetical protein